MGDKQHEFSGLLSKHSHGETDDALFLSGVQEPLCEALEFMHKKHCTVRYWITDKPATKDEATTAILHRLDGVADVLWCEHYSELTGYLWTDEDLSVGGHDLMEELRSNVGKYLIMEVTVHE